ncbi:MAG TPA: nucleoside transporter C-terminal domain-containing protein [Gemmatimonadales bacterium]|nr:nucleoside transporter C-terminal domain-containing protein [Gemmatimonadales bacterium]
MILSVLAQTATAAESFAALRDGLDTPLAQRLMGVVGMVTMIGLTVLMSYDRKRINWRLVATGVTLQVAFGLVVLKTAAGRAFFETVGNLITGLLAFQEQGARFIFGNLVQSAVPVGTAGANGAVDTSAGMVAQTGAFFAFNVLPTIIFFSALMSVLYYLGVMQLIVRGLAWGMQKTLRTSGAETLSASGNIFLGQTEAPLLIKPFVGTMTKSELVTVMVGGFATVAGGVLAAYVGMLAGILPGIASHLLAASVMNAPAGLYLSKILMPETEIPKTAGSLDLDVDATRVEAERLETPRRFRFRKGESAESSVIEAAANGAAQGVQLAINVAAMLMAFVALVAMLNAGLGWMGGLVGVEGLSLQMILGTILRPLAWVMGVPWQDTAYVGGLIGLKTSLNEFVAYAQFATDLGSGVAIEPRSAVILTYALLGFANFSSIAIQIGGIGGLAPERRGEIAKFGLKAMIAGNLAAFISASLAGMLA